MKQAIFGVLKGEPALFAGLLTAVTALVTMPLPGSVQAAITAVMAIITAIGVRALVWSPAAVVETVKAATEDAATKVAETLTDVSVGATGIVTEAGQAVVDLATMDASRSALKAAGFSRSEINKA